VTPPSARKTYTTLIQWAVPHGVADSDLVLTLRRADGDTRASPAHSYFS